MNVAELETNRPVQTSETPPIETDSKQPEAQLCDPSQAPHSPLECESLTRLDGFKDAFLEERYRADCGTDVNDLARRNIITFLSKVTQLDQYYNLAAPTADLCAGYYRIRDEGGAMPVITIKKDGDGVTNFSETVDIVAPNQDTIDLIRTHGRFIAIIEKDRITYRFKSRPDCLLNQDSVRGLGDFIDLKADSPEAMAEFLRILNPDPVSKVQGHYLSLTQEKGTSALKLKVWQFHERFKDYIMGVVSGTLTPLGFLCATLASTDAKATMVIALLSAGLCDGISDAVGNSQTTQSNSKSPPLAQAHLFLKTMVGKCIIPCCFIPPVLATDSNLAIGGISVALASLILGGTAAVQAIAKERPVLPAVSRILAWGAAATAAGTLVGKLVPPALQALLGM